MNRGDRSVPVALVLGLTGGIGVTVAAATLGALVASWWWPLDLLTSFHPQYAVVAGAVALIHFALRSPRTAVIPLVAALLNASLAAPFVVGGPPAAAGDGERLTIMSFNVGVSNPQRAEIAAYMTEADPDVLVVIESSFEWEDALAAAGNPLAAIAIVPRERVTGITLMASPRLGARATPVGFADPEEALAMELDLDGAPIILLALHPPSPTSPERAERRNRILADAGDWVAAAGKPVLVVGDLNATPWSPAFEALETRGRLADSSRGSGLQPTWPSGWGPLMIPIDHALFTEGLAVVERSTGPSLGSAHRPLLVTVAAAG